MSEEKVLLKTYDGFTKIVSIPRDEERIEITRQLSMGNMNGDFDKIVFYDTGDRNNNGMRVFEQTTEVKI